VTTSGARRLVAAGLTLQAIAAAWLAVIASPTLAYPHLVPPYALAGAGRAPFFAPIARMVIDFAPPALRGVASGTSNGLRQLGTVLGAPGCSVMDHRIVSSEYPLKT